jgi:hypothetical protein
MVSSTSRRPDYPKGTHINSYFAASLATKMVLCKGTLIKKILENETSNKVEKHFVTFSL